MKQFQVSNCNVLKGIIVKNDCCRDYSGSFSVQKCNSLEVILIGNNSFTNYKTFTIKELKALTQIGIGTFQYEDGEQFRKVERVFFDSWFE